MYTQFDKAIVAAIMGLVGVANYFGFHWGVSAEAVSAIVGVVTPIIVMLVPNLPKDKS